MFNKSINKYLFTGGIVCAAILAGCILIKNSRTKSTPINMKQEQNVLVSDKEQDFEDIEGQTAIASFFEEIPVEDTNFFLSDENANIQTLIHDYLKAKLDVNQEKLEQITVTDSIDYAILQRQIEYIKNYHNVSLCIAPGFGEIDYVVYVRYEVEFPLAETYAPCLDEYYVVKDADSYKIYLKPLEEATQNYVLNLRVNEHVQELIRDVSMQLSAVLKQDSALAEIYEGFAK